MPHIIDPSFITTLHAQSICSWKAEESLPKYSGFYQLVVENHSFNYKLWHAEDRARRDDMGFEFVYKAKREIDGFNQQRNNRMEAMDEWLFTVLAPQSPDHCPVNSESPGMIIDRLSILALKAYHMALQTERPEVHEEHRANCAAKLQTIHQQRDQLERCLGAFLDEISNKKRTFRVYHQFKMYNDPTLNPELYTEPTDPK